MRCSSSDVTVSGGISTTTSPSGRSSTPRSTAAAHTRRPQRRPSCRRRELDAAHEPAQAHLVHRGVRRDAVVEQRRAARRSGRARCASTDQRVEQLEVPERHRGRERVPRVRVPVVQRALGEVGAEERVEHRPLAHRRRHRQVAGGEALADARAGRVGGRTAPRRTACRCARTRWRPRRRSGARRAPRHAAPSAREPVGVGELHARRALARAARRSPPRARGACAATMATAVSKQRGSANCGARSTGKRSGSKRSVPKPPSPTESAPMVSPWYAPPNARNCVWPATPRFTQYWNAIFSACSTAAAPSDAKRKCGSSTGTTRASASASSTTTTVAVAEHGGVRAALELLADGVVELGHAVAEGVDPQRRDGVEVAAAVDVDQLVAFTPLDDERARSRRTRPSA